MKINNIFTFLGLLTTTLVSASRSDFYGENDNRPELFKILDDHVGTIKISLDDKEWSTMKEKSLISPLAMIEGPLKAEKYGTDNATLEFFIKDTDYRVLLEPGEFSFKLGGQATRTYMKPGYNIKIKNGSVYDVKFLRLRANIRDATMMREKLSSDLLYKMGVPSTSANYVNVEVNGEDCGMFVLTNKVKKDFIKKYYGENKTTNLYECEYNGLRFEDNGIGQKCNNVEEELIDYRDDIQAFNDAINNATSVEDIEKVLDVDQFLHSMAFEFLTVSWDQFLSYAHNYFWYKKKDGKWTIILNDFDETFGHDYSHDLYEYYDKTFGNKSYIPYQDEINIPNISIRDLDLDHKFLKYLIHDDDTHFRSIIGEAVKKAFNPKVLIPRIDEIADLIRDDLAKSYEKDEMTGLPKGYFNTIGINPNWSMVQFEDCINYVSWNNNNIININLALKFFIEERFKYICHTYGINPETLELIEPRPKVAFWGIRNKYKPSFNGQDFLHDSVVSYTYPDLDKEDYMQEEYNADPEKNNKPTNYEYPLHRYESGEDPFQLPIEIPDKDEKQEEEKCWSETLGYPCCKSSCHIYVSDDSGEWGYEEDHWCGIPSTCSESKCWSEKLGYPCCSSTCHVYVTDDDGKWGYEEDHWCGILQENC